MFRLMCKTVYLAALFVACYGAVDLSKYMKICNRNSVDVNDCMIEAVQKGISTMVNGIPDLGVPSIDPYKQKELKLEYKNNQIYAKMNMKDIYVEGVNGATVHDARVRADDDRLHIEIDLTAPKITMRGEYEGEGRYNALRINASGTFSTVMSDLVWTWKLDGVPEKIGDETYMRINSFYMRPDVGNMVSKLVNNNLDSKELTDLGTRFMNENWRVLYREMLPYAQANWNKSGTHIANKIFMKIPYIQIFPISS